MLDVIRENIYLHLSLTPGRRVTSPWLWYFQLFWSKYDYLEIGTRCSIQNILTVGKQPLLPWKSHMIETDSQLTILTHTYSDDLLHGKCYLLWLKRNKILEGMRKKILLWFWWIKFSLTLSFLNKNQAKMNINQWELLGQRRLWFS